MVSATMSVKILFYQLIIVLFAIKCSANDILGCGGFVKSHVSLDFSKVEIGLYTKEGSLKEKTECAPTNGYYFLPLYEKGEYILKVHPPAGWSFEPSEVQLMIDGETDKCSTGQDVNFSFNGFGITGKVITAGQKQGPGGVAVQLVDEKGVVRNTVTTVGGDFHFTPVIPGKYTLKASHPRWILEPSQAIVQVKEGNTALPVGVLAVKGYDVSGSVSSFGSPFQGLYVVLYSKEENPKYRIEGCNTALLQGVPDSPICHVTTAENGEFRFGLVPAGEYKLKALETNPGQVAVTYNVKPKTVDFTVRHDSLFLRNAFEITGFTAVGSVLSAPGKPLAGARVSLDGEPLGKSDAMGKFTLPNLLPSYYSVTFQHEHCQIEDIRIQVTTEGPRGSLSSRVTSWRVCGEVTPPRAARLVFIDINAKEATAIPLDGTTGKWCTYLPLGVYTAKVEVSEEEQKSGLQYYPVTQKVSVGHGPVDNIKFSQLVAEVTGKVECLSPALCDGLTVTLTHLSAGFKKQQTTVRDGAYKFTSISAGRIELSVPTGRACWTDNSRRVSVTEEKVNVPSFVQLGYIVNVQSTHQMELEYTVGESTGVWQVAAGLSSHCARSGDPHQLQPRSCHQFRPERATVTPATDTKTIYFEAIAHSVVIKITTPEPVSDLVLTINQDAGTEKQLLEKFTRDGGSYVYEYTIYMAEGEVSSVSASSSTLVFSPGAGQVVGRSNCQPSAIILRGRPALTLKGKLQPAVAGATITLTSDDLKLTHVTTEDGAYSFGPLDASKSYSIAAEKESYVFSEPDADGNIKAHKLAEIVVKLVDDADGTPLQGALVSVSGGSYRHNAATRADGTLRFAGLQPHQYYMRPHFKEFKFTPHHHLVTVEDGRTHEITLRGVRVAWSVIGRAVSLAGVGLPRVPLVAAVKPGGATCATEDATTDDNGNFRIRGLVPECEYTLQLKESSAPELSGLKIIKAPDTIHVRGGQDARDVTVVAGGGGRLTDAVVVVRAAPAHYKHLSLSLALADTPTTTLFTAKLDNTGFTPRNNPGVLHVLPRLRADNNTYVLQLDSTLSKATHTYNEQIYYFNSDGKFKHFTIEFFPKVKTTEQELRQTSFLFLPLLAVVGIAYYYREALLTSLPRAAARARAPPRAAARAPKPTRVEYDDIDQIVNTVNQTKRTAKKKFI